MQQLRKDWCDGNSVTITFQTRQKNGDRGMALTQHRNKNPGQADIHPVRTLADMTTRIRRYERTARPTVTINAFATTNADEPQNIMSSSKMILGHLRGATKLAGEERLGLRADRICTHSIPSGAAMAMHLLGMPSETIQMVGQCRSRTFTRYLRIQVPNTSLGLAAHMTN